MVRAGAGVSGGIGWGSVAGNERVSTRGREQRGRLGGLSTEERRDKTCVAVGDRRGEKEEEEQRLHDMVYWQRHIYCIGIKQALSFYISTIFGFGCT